MVVIDRRIKNLEYDNVVTDNVQSAFTIVNHLIEQRHHRIGAVFGAGSTTGRERREGLSARTSSYTISNLLPIWYSSLIQGRKMVLSRPRSCYNCLRGQMPFSPVIAFWLLVWLRAPQGESCFDS